MTGNDADSISQGSWDHMHSAIAGLPLLVLGMYGRFTA